MLKIYKPIPFVLMVLLAVNAMCLAQGTVAVQPNGLKSYSQKQFDRSFDTKLSVGINNMVNNLLVKVGDIASKVELEVNDNTKNIDINVNPKIDNDLNGLLKSFNFDMVPYVNFNLSNGGDSQDNNNGVKVEKVKNYSKTYPIDGNDQIKLSNQYGRITIITWDRNEIKVDVQIKAQAEDGNTAQKLLDGVQIRDSKSADQVSFRTSIEPSSNSSWKIWEWGDKKKHKVEINYTVYMPAKTDLNVEDSYGGIELPDLSGKVKISCSYGSVQAQNLSNPSNYIEGSYGSLKVASINGARLDYSYGSVEIDQCNNLKANLSYGSFKLGKLKGTADLDLSYMGGTKIEEMGANFKRLNVNASYSGLSVDVPGNNNFNFDITTTYGAFKYADDKITITSKTPDDSKHYSSTKNYKGHFGRDGGEAQVTVHSTYGNVTFD